MFELEIQGRGRRSKVISVSKNNVKYEIGDFVDCGSFIGLIASFKQGESESTHLVELLHCFDEQDHVRASNLLEFHPLEKLNKKTTVELTEAINLKTQQVCLLSKQPGKDVHAFAKYVNSLFTTQNRRKSLNFEVSESEMSDSSSEFEDDPLPQRKQVEKRRGRPRKNPLETASTKSPAKSPTKSPAKSPKKTVRSPRKRTKTAGSVTTSPDDIDDLSMKPNLEFSLGSGIDIMDVEEEQDTVMKHLKKGEHPKFIPFINDSSLLQQPQSQSYLYNEYDELMATLHPASDPPSHPCRETQYDQLFYTLETAIEAETGTCVYVSGTPGTGKTSTVREVISQLALRVESNELKPFTFLEINGMKLVHPNSAYEHLWEVLCRGQLAVSNAISALESAFNTEEPFEKRGNIVVLLDEVDQLVTKGQQLMYNFFNWPALEHSRLIVIAIANTMDLPERMLSNKISSRVGLTRIQFPGYTHEQLKSIVYQRIDDKIHLVSPEAIDYATRKVSGVGGDVRKVLDIISRALKIAKETNSAVTIQHVREVILRSQESPVTKFLQTLSVSSKVILCAILARTRRQDNIEIPLHDVLKQASQFVRSSSISSVLMDKLYPQSSVGRTGRLAMFQHAIMELVESGILVHQAVRGEATPNVRLMVPSSVLKSAIENDAMVKGMI